MAEKSDIPSLSITTDQLYQELTGKMPNTIQTASNLEVLLHCYHSPGAHPRLYAPAIKEGVDYLLRQEMIYPDDKLDGVYHTTMKGQVYLKHLMNIPFPTPSWKMG